VRLADTYARSYVVVGRRGMIWPPKPLRFRWRATAPSETMTSPRSNVITHAGVLLVSGPVIAGPDQGICILVCAPAITRCSGVIAGALWAAGAAVIMRPPPRERPGAGGACGP
jgi:hypothetical protein